jgi:hypothetical protein
MLICRWIKQNPEFRKVDLDSGFHSFDRIALQAIGAITFAAARNPIPIAIWSMERYSSLLAVRCSQSDSDPDSDSDLKRVELGKCAPPHLLAA